RRAGRGRAEWIGADHGDVSARSFRRRRAPARCAQPAGVRHRSAARFRSRYRCNARCARRPYRGACRSRRPAGAGAGAGRPMTLLVACVAMGLEWLLGYPQKLVAAIGHPVMWMGWLIDRLEARLNAPERGFAQRQWGGAITLGLVLLTV